MLFRSERGKYIIPTISEIVSGAEGDRCFCLQSSPKVCAVGHLQRHTSISDLLCNVSQVVWRSPCQTCHSNCGNERLPKCST